MADAATSLRKPQPKLRALKDHTPRLCLDIKKAESLLQEIKAIDRKAFGIYDEFADIIQGPMLRASRGESIEVEAKNLLDSLQRAISDFTMGVVKQRTEARNLMAAAVAGMKLYRPRQVKKGAPS